MAAAPVAAAVGYDVSLEREKLALEKLKWKREAELERDKLETTQAEKLHAGKTEKVDRDRQAEVEGIQLNWEKDKIRTAD